MVTKILERLKPKGWRAHERRIYLNHHARDFSRELRKNTTTMIISAFGLVAALMWQDAIKSFITTLIPVNDPNNYTLKTYAALVVTIISVVGIYFISKLQPSD